MGAAAALVALKLTFGLATHSLGLLAEALHSGTDLIAALLTFFAIGVALRPPDRAHAYGHGKAEHLAALGEGGFVVAAAIFIAWRSISHIVGRTEPTVRATWYVLVVVAGVILIDATRAVISLRTARQYRSPALQANALHFGSDLAGSTAVLVGLLFVRAGFEDADSAAALFVAVLVLTASCRLIRRNVDVLMDRAPAGAYETAAAAIRRIRPPVRLGRLRIRQAAGRHFADVVIEVSPDAAVGQGHAAADAVERAIERALPESDVVVHVEPAGAKTIRERVQAAAVAVPRVREVHNVSAVDTEDGTAVSLHLKLPGSLPLEEAHGVASQVERAIAEAVPGIASVQTHLEPLAEQMGGGAPSQADASRVEEAITGIVRERTGGPPRELRILNTDRGLVAFLTVQVDSQRTLVSAHGDASEIEERIRAAVPDLDDVVVHTEP